MITFPFQYESLKNLYEEIPTMLNDMPIDDVIVYQIDLTKMKEQIPFYTSFNEFYNDIGWIEHNCVILFHGKFDFPLLNLKFC